VDGALTFWLPLGRFKTGEEPKPAADYCGIGKAASIPLFRVFRALAIYANVCTLKTELVP
jgi:hypothetical protein